MNEEPTLPLDSAPSVPAETPAARSAWGGFSLLARVGFGGFGEVYRAWDPHLQREVALKLLLPGVAGGDAEYEVMLREARALASVQHPNVVHVYGIDRHDGRVGFWTDFVKGKTLSVLLGEQGPFGCREAAGIGLDVTKALSAVHRAGIVHRDIKAENVMREEGGRILLMDFGLSALPQRQFNLAGTPNYMAPELFRKSPASVASDIYAMGVLLYYLVSGAYPVQVSRFTAAEVAEEFQRRVPLMDRRPDLPESFLRTVSVATEVDPAKRFASAGKLAESLAETLGGAASGAHVAAEAVPAKKEKPAWRRYLITAVVLGLVFEGQLVRTFRRVFSPSHSGSAAVTGEPDDYHRGAALLGKSYKNANTAQAVKAFEAIPETDNNYALAQAGLGSAYFIQYRASRDPKLLEKSEAATNRAIQLDPALAPPYVTLARIAAMEGDTALATQDAQKAMQADPRSGDPHRAMAEVYDAEGRRQDAIAEMQKAEDLEPDDWRWPLNLGNYYYSAGKLDEAAVKYQRSADLAPDNATAYYDLGLVKMHQNQLDAAQADFERSLKIEVSASREQMLGELFLAKGKYPEAVAAAEKAAALSPNDPLIWNDEGVAYYMAGDRAKATEAYRNAIAAGEMERKKEPKNAGLLVLLANDNAMVGDAERSKTLLRQALALSPDDPDVDYQAGATYELLGQRERGMDLIAKALARGYHAVEFDRDPLLAGLRSDPRWGGVLGKAKAQKAVDTRVKSD